MILRFACVLLVLSTSATAGVRSSAIPLGDFLFLTASADQLAIYRGLPRRSQDRKFYAEENRTKPHFLTFDNGFYREPLALPQTELDAIIAALDTPGVLIPHRGAKLCGGFHADYLPAWRREGKNVAVMLLCYGCHEAILATADKKAKMDLSSDGAKRLRDALPLAVKSGTE
ncbi:MAG: hypothetical protein ABII82_14690 [Verrucomicrobiota bacterium]